MKHLLILAATAMLGACSSTQTTPPLSQQGSAKVGVVVLVDEAPTHIHHGSLAFFDFAKAQPTEHNYQQQLGDAVSQLLEQANHQAVALSPTSTLMAERSNLFTYLSADMAFEADVASELNTMASANQLDYVIAIYPKKVAVDPKSNDYVAGLGLYSYCNFGHCNAAVLSSVDARIYDASAGKAVAISALESYQQINLNTIELADDPSKLAPDTIDAAAQQGVDAFVKRLTVMLQQAGMV
ncbi:hypothetical protein K0504_02065 [Neiella marina]|uniref:Uncharacterized protein n=1 Tax=Neiella holothuriorum TaxID=2870530 RepID=A0ABS7EDD0_9GAMM|nr:hypothetical protein [Neiella holothuriorum]MBW8189806.1 hypothetical protein [Neiella holothuriorum]